MSICYFSIKKLTNCFLVANPLRKIPELHAGNRYADNINWVHVLSPLSAERKKIGQHQLADPGLQ